MAKSKISLEPNHYYHVWTHANGEENLFRSNENYRFFLEKYSYFISPIADTFAYCLMPNHLHLMVRIKNEEELFEFVRKKKNLSTLQGLATLGGLSSVISRQFSHLFNSYTQAYNKSYNRKGGLFIPNFRRKLVTSKKYYLALVAYIHLNPVHHGFVDRPDDWLHSSFHAFRLDKRTRVKKDEALNWAGGSDKFFRLHREIRMGELRRVFGD